MKKQILVISGLLVIFTALVVTISLFQSREIEKSLDLSKPAPALEKAAAPEQKAPLVPSRPEDFGITITEPGEGPVTQVEWDRVVSEKMGDIKAENPHVWQAVLAELHKQDPAQAQEFLKQQEDELKRVKELLVNDPDNQELKGKLERLMILQSINKELN